MAPIIDALKVELAGRIDVEFLDVSVTENLARAQTLGVQTIPTQIYLAADGKELWRHEGFMAKADILAKWRELGHDVAAAGDAVGQAAPAPSVIERWVPVQPDGRPRDQVCRMCEGDIDAKTLVTVAGPDGPVRHCSPHCYFIMLSCLLEDKVDFEKKVAMTDYASGKLVPAAAAVYLYGMDETSGRPWVRAFAERAVAEQERVTAGGNLLSYTLLMAKEFGPRCGFCDRACYPEDSALVICGGVHTLGCCAHCAMGVAARTGKDIEVHQPDGLTGEPVVVRTQGDRVVSTEPADAVAWFGMRQKPDGTWASAGCFHQGFFRNAGNLRAWLETRPLATGKQITIQQSLSDKLKMSPEQIQKACKIGECK
jgi:hypothetical protein